ncbi:tRNA-uridine aminocarboxypropyltransferase 2-like [Oppia nitens]|uniref:tRNA-uridine aminocarboxypropyltransferase 2-like n=1 Tax=Oppia nitens TaxID=1686743 RepID=UPI0023DC11F1|nr:tRNA-uridine aminocarboxypropyltransferase 2-like [Oppia nitens]
MDDTDDNLDTVLQEFADIGAEPPNKRQLCPKCSRPMRVCWCPHLTERLIETKSRVVILQHPNEEKRCLRTAKILELSLASGRCLVIRGKRFTSYKYPVLKELIDGQSVMTTNGCETIARKTVVVYPGIDKHQSCVDSSKNFK